MRAYSCLCLCFCCFYYLLLYYCCVVIITKALHVGVLFCLLEFRTNALNVVYLFQDVLKFIEALKKESSCGSWLCPCGDGMVVYYQHLGWWGWVRLDVEVRKSATIVAKLEKPASFFWVLQTFASVLVCWCPMSLQVRYQKTIMEPVCLLEIAPANLYASV